MIFCLFPVVWNCAIENKESIENFSVTVLCFIFWGWGGVISKFAVSNYQAKKKSISFLLLVSLKSKTCSHCSPHCFHLVFPFLSECYSIRLYK